MSDFSFKDIEDICLDFNVPIPNVEYPNPTRIVERRMSKLITPDLTQGWLISYL